MAGCSSAARGAPVLPRAPASGRCIAPVAQRVGGYVWQRHDMVIEGLAKKTHNGNLFPPLVVRYEGGRHC